MSARSLVQDSAAPASVQWLAPLAEAGAHESLPSSLARRRRTCPLAHSSRTAPRQPCADTAVLRSTFPRSERPAEYRQAGEVTAMLSSWMPTSSHLDADLRLPRFHGRPRPAGKPGRTTLLRPLPVARAKSVSAARVGSDQNRCRGGAEAEHRRLAGSCRCGTRCRPFVRSSDRTDHGRAQPAPRPRRVGATWPLDRSRGSWSS
jgi:hypothetical protein